MTLFCLAPIKGRFWLQQSRPICVSLSVCILRIVHNVYVQPNINCVWPLSLASLTLCQQNLLRLLRDDFIFNRMGKLCHLDALLLFTGRYVQDTGHRSLFYQYRKHPKYFQTFVSTSKPAASSSLHSFIVSFCGVSI